MEVIAEAVRRPEQNIVIVTHGALMSLLIRRYEPSFGFVAWMNLSNPDVYAFTAEEDQTMVRRIWG